MKAQVLRALAANSSSCRSSRVKSGPADDQVEAFVADLDYAQHSLLALSRIGAGHQFVNRGGVKLPSPFSEAGLILSKMLACFTRVKLLNSSFFW